MDVIAHFKSSGGAKSFTVLSARIVQDANHITRHLLECIYTYLYVTRGPLGGGGGGGAGAGAGAGAGGGGAYNPFAPAAAAKDSATGTAHGDDRSASLETEDMQIFKIYKDAALIDPDNDTGLSITEAIAIAKRSNISAATVQRITEKLMMDGMIYSTVDDEHFRST